MVLATDAADPMPIGAAVGMALLLMVSGLVIAGIGRAAARGSLRRNRLAGIRTAASLASDDAWQACHRAAGRLMVAAGAVPAALGLPLLLRPSNGVGAAIVLTALAIMLVLVLWSGVKGHRAARAVLHDRDDVRPTDA